jgi:positive regulator of sigma E activity
MIETSGVVINLDGEYAWVRAEDAGKACGACSQRDGCQSAESGGLLDAGMQRKHYKMLRLPNVIHARPGDSVTICAANGVVLQAAWRAYGIPLILGMAAAFVGQSLFNSELATFLCLLFGLICGFVGVRRFVSGSSRQLPILSMTFRPIH